MDTKNYHPEAIENAIYRRWEAAGYFSPSGTGSSYCILIPPPNVTGSLHMGHAFQATLMDILIRYHRMRGHCCLWQAGTDHAGIATQMVVEKKLQAEGRTRQQLGQQRFVDAVWRWKDSHGDRIAQQWRRLGASIDWEQSCFTMDEARSQAVTECFVKLYQEGLIYRGKRLINWDPVLQTAVSDLEVSSSEEKGYIYQLRYPIAGQKGHLVVATTRPETLFGDSAVAVHPEDERYRQYVGKSLQLPLSERLIPIIADSHVDPAFGSGCVKITPAHDFNDYAVGQHHRLPMHSIFTSTATLNDTVPAAYRGLDRYQARKKLLQELQDKGLLEATQDHHMVIPRGDRSGSALEPMLTDQWFVRAKTLAGPAIAAVKQGAVRFVPANWEKTYFHWMENIEDWCISRQIWWGHRIPAWYDPEGNIYVGHDEAACRQQHNLPDDLPLQRDNDVLDTWFSSSLWPLSTLGWPEKTAKRARFYPSNVLVTGFDIIFFWVARMIMMGLKFGADVPFKEVYIHGLIRDAEGQKMSKTRGNIIDPLDLIDGIDLESLLAKRRSPLLKPEQQQRIAAETRQQYPQGIPAHGCDALRFTFAALANTGRDIRFDMGRIEGYRNFCNKLWNASRYVLLQSEKPPQKPPPEALGIADRWIISLLQQQEQDMQQQLACYRFDRAATALHQFLWDEYCDWYLEMSKALLHNKNTPEAQRQACLYTLIHVLEAALRLAHPFIPFITEELWQKLAPLAGKSGDSILLQPYPEADLKRLDSAACQDINWLKQVVGELRRQRSERGIAPGLRLPLLWAGNDGKNGQRINNFTAQLQHLLRLTAIEESTNIAPQQGIFYQLEEFQLYLPLEQVIDKEVEEKRLQKLIQELQMAAQRAGGKLANSQFLQRAPADIVTRERERLQDMEGRITSLHKQLERLTEGQ